MRNPCSVGYITCAILPHYKPAQVFAPCCLRHDGYLFLVYPECLNPPKTHKQWGTTSPFKISPNRVFLVRVPLSEPDTIASAYRFTPASDPAMTQASPSQMACIGGVNAKHQESWLQVSFSAFSNIPIPKGILQIQNLLISSGRTNEDHVSNGFGVHIARFHHATNTDVVSLDQRNGMSLGEVSRRSRHRE